ncbi:MAG: hypothetical protein ACREJU_08195 [Nitrospiraceae bacterium]
MTPSVTQLATMLCLGGIVTGSAMGCVASSTYEQAQKSAEQRLQYEQRLSQELAISNRQVKQRIEELESTVRNLREQLARTDKDWKDTRDELLRMKIDKEQSKGRDRLSQLERPEAGKDDRLKLQGRAEDAMRRMKELLRQLQSAVDQLSGREPL